MGSQPGDVQIGQFNLPTKTFTGYMCCHVIYVSTTNEDMRQNKVINITNLVDSLVKKIETYSNFHIYKIELSTDGAHYHATMSPSKSK